MTSVVSSFLRETGGKTQTNQLNSPASRIQAATIFLCDLSQVASLAVMTLVLTTATTPMVMYLTYGDIE